MRCASFKQVYSSANSANGIHQQDTAFTEEVHAKTRNTYLSYFLQDVISNLLMSILYLSICSGTAMMMGFAEATPDHLGKNHGGTLQIPPHNPRRLMLRPQTKASLDSFAFFSQLATKPMKKTATT